MYSLFFCSQLLVSFPDSSSSSSADLHTHTQKHTHTWHEQEPAFVPLQDPKAWAIIPWIESCVSSSSSSSSENAMNSNVRWLWIPLNSSALLSSWTKWMMPLQERRNTWDTCRKRNDLLHDHDQLKLFPLLVQHGQRLLPSPDLFRNEYKLGFTGSSSWTSSSVVQSKHPPI